MALFSLHLTLFVLYYMHVGSKIEVFVLLVPEICIHLD